MLNTLITAGSPSLPAGYCWPANPQQFVNDVFPLVPYQLNTDVGNSFFNTGSDVPSAANRVFPWLNATDGRWYQWSYTYGIWISTFWPLASSKKPSLYYGDLADLPTEDGGNANPVSIVDGPFWEQDTDFNGRSPMGPGAIPTSTPAKTLSVGENYGEGSHLQTGDEVGPHTHPITITGKALNGTGQPPRVVVDDDVLTNVNDTQGGTAQNNTYTASQERMPIIPPVRGCYFIKRTIRQFYTLGP